MGKTEMGSEGDKQKYQKILACNYIIKTIQDIIIVEPELRGEHMASACDYVTIKFADGSEDLELFTKRYVNNPTYSSFTKVMSIFEKESEFFNSMLPDAKVFCVKKTGNDKLISFFPKCYFGDESLIVLENLTKRGYFMLDKMEKVDFHQAEMVMTKLAKFHGVFHSMIQEAGHKEFSQKYPYVFKEAYLTSSLKELMSPFFDNGLATCVRIIEANDKEHGKDAVEWLNNQMGKCFDVMCDLVIHNPEESLSVVNHGDCWTNNMMFLKDKNDFITDHILVDLQIVRYGSPNLDLGYFLFTSVKSEVRRTNWKSLLKLYFDTLSKTVTSLGFSINFSFDDLVENYKKKCLMGVFMALSFMSTIGAMKDVDFESCGNNIDELGEYFKRVVHKWVEDNPDRAQTASQEIIEIIADYKGLQEK